MVKLKSVYEVPSDDDGQRILILRLWPSEVDVYLAKINRWMKALAPSYDLLEWLRENPKEWNIFEDKYLKELRDEEKQKLIKELVLLSKEGNITLLYPETDSHRSAARIIAKLLAEESQD